MKVIIFLTVLILSVTAQANSFISEPACFVPNKPLFFSPYSYELRYQQDVKEYRECIYSFISKQEQAIKLHQESILQAKKLLNKHVR